MKRLVLALLLFACGDPPNQTCEGCSIDVCGYEESSESEQLLRFANERGDVEAVIVRDYVGNGVGFSAIYELRGFGLLMDGRVDCFNQGLEYENSHHNWLDRARAIVPGGKIQLSIEFQPEDPNNPGSEWKWRFVLTGPSFDPVALRITQGKPQGK